jgi:tetratricopeptide (TPR) repeat protein
VLKHICLYLALPVLIACSFAQDTPSSVSPPPPQKSIETLLKEGSTAYRTGRFEAAIENYQAALQQDPTAIVAYAGLTRTYLKQQKIQLALETANKAVETSPDSAAAHTALGEVYFRQARMAESEKEFLKAINSPIPDARAHLGLARLYSAYSLYAHAKAMLDKAHALDPTDLDIQRRWISTLSRAQRIEWLENYLSGPTNDDPEARENLEDYLALLKERAKQPRDACRLATNLSSTEARLEPMLINPRRMHGYGLTVKFNEQSSRLMLDTGASGLVINGKLAKKAGIGPLSTSHLRGIGDQGAVSGFIGYANSIKIGDLEFTNCLVEVSDKRSLLDDDGLIGADVFSHYLVTLDFAGQKMRLQELPKRPGQEEAPPTLGTTRGADDAAAEQTEETKTDAAQPDPAKKQPVPSHGPYDRYIAPEMESYTKIFRFGHDLLIPTEVNDTPQKLFLIDTGSFRNMISPDAAREVTKVHDDPGKRIHGISGSVNKVYSADKATLRFSHIREESQDITAIDLASISRSTGTEVSGILGFDTFRYMVIKIDYRDGLVDFEYKPPGR